jgi:hypothetical protein
MTTYHRFCCIYQLGEHGLFGGKLRLNGLARIQAVNDDVPRFTGTDGKRSGLETHQNAEAVAPPTGVQSGFVIDKTRSQGEARVQRTARHICTSNQRLPWQPHREPRKGW